MTVKCPRCGREFAKSTSMGGHAQHCGVTAQELFWTRVKKAGPHNCWPWTGARTADGYGSMRSRGKHLQPHRLSYEIANGPIPPGLQVLHRCDHPWCVNPAHLWAGTIKENMADASKKNRVYRGGNRPPHIAFPQARDK